MKFSGQIDVVFVFWRWEGKFRLFIFFQHAKGGVAAYHETLQVKNVAALVPVMLKNLKTYAF